MSVSKTVNIPRERAVSSQLGTLPHSLCLPQRWYSLNIITDEREREISRTLSNYFLFLKTTQPGYTVYHFIGVP